eukprot:641133-Pyramimonas_sp.AAC.1
MGHHRIPADLTIDLTSDPTYWGTSGHHIDSSIDLTIDLIQRDTTGHHGTPRDTAGRCGTPRATAGRAGGGESFVVTSP